MKKLLTFALLAFLCQAHAGEIIVNNGESIHHALRKAREWRRSGDSRCQGGITITIKSGRYYMQEPLLIRPEDSGTEASPTILRGEGAIICGDAPQAFTQIWPAEGMERMADFDIATRTIVIPTPPKSVLKTKGLVMRVHQRWAIALLRVKEMQVNGALTTVSFMEPESRLEFEHPWPQPVIGGEKGSSSFALGTIEQRDGIEQLLIVSGTDDDPVTNVAIEGLTFENTCWNRQLHQGHVTLQGGFPLVDAYKLTEHEGLPWDQGLENQAWVERPVAAVTVSHARHVDVRQCMFRNLGATALDYADDTHSCTITRNSFTDIGGTAIMAGSFAESPREVHRPYGNLASRCENLTISHNNITRATTFDWGAVAVGCGYVRDINICFNNIDSVNYSGICVGWGWTPLYTGMQNNVIAHNTVSNYACQLYDAGGIYTLSNQPNSYIQDNTLSLPAPAPYATNDRGFGIYLDARTDGFTLSGNTMGGKTLRQSDTGFNNPGPSIVFK